MFFYLSKILWIVAAPTNLLILMALLGLVLTGTRLRRLGRVLCVTGILGLLILGASPAATLLVRPLEDRFPQLAQDDPRPVDGIVVLGGAIGFGRGQVAFNEAASRMTEALALARRHPQARIVFTGGHAEIVRTDDLSEADAARIFFRNAGIPDERVTYEGASRNTRENAVLTAGLVTPKAGERWLLVTSAYHMPRSIGCFRQVGFEAEAYPVDYRSDGDARDYRTISRSFADGLRLADLAVKEWIGLIAYRLAGYIPEMLPSPASGSRSR